MDYRTLLLLITFVFLIFTLRLFNQTQNSAKLPPGPRPLPIIGNILELGRNPHQALTKLSKIYGPIMTLKLGHITTIVISSPQVAKQVLQQNGPVFSNRTLPHAVCVHDHHKFSMVFQPISAEWKKLRRACATKVFSQQLLDSTKVLRQQKLQEMLDYVKERCNKGEVLDIGEAVFTTVLNSISNTFFSVDLAHSAPDEKSQEFKNIIRGIMEDAWRPNVANFFPFLRPLDPQRLHAKMTNNNKLLKIIEGVIEDRMCSRVSGTDSEVCNDVLDSLLNNSEETSAQLSHNEILHLFMETWQWNCCMYSPLSLKARILLSGPKLLGNLSQKDFQLMNAYLCFQSQPGSAFYLQNLGAIRQHYLILLYGYNNQRKLGIGIVAYIVLSLSGFEWWA